MKLFSPQTKKVYETLLQKQKLTAREISSLLNISPNTVYRSVIPLLKMGLVSKNGRHPCCFVVQIPQQSLVNLQEEIKKEMITSFFSDLPKKQLFKKEDNFLNLSFLKTRKDFLQNTGRDIEKAQKEVNLLVSGLEVPTETILNYKKALDRNVRIKIIVQNKEEINREMFQNWQKMGCEVRYFPLLEARLLVIDQKILYLASYNLQDKEKSIGIRFVYAPLARIMNDWFVQKWQQAKNIDHADWLNPNELKYL